MAAQAIREEFGSLIGEDIQEQLDAAGESVQDFVDRLVNRLSTQGRAAVDSTQNSFQNLQNSVFLLSAEIGDRFTPALGAAARGISGFLDDITEAIQGTERFSEVLARVNAEITAATGQAELQTAIEGGTEALEAFIAQAEEAIRNNSVFFGGREDAFLTGQINEAREALEQLQGVQQGNIQTEADLRAELALQEAELERIQGLQTERNNLIAEQGASARRASAIYLENLTEEEIAVIESIEQLEAKLAAYQAAGMAAAESTDTATQGTDDATESTQELTTEVERLTEVYRGLAANIQQANELFDFIDQAGVSDFYRLAAGELMGYGDAVDAVIPSVTDAEQEQEALNAAVQAGIDSTSGDPLGDYVDGLELTSEAAGDALGVINEVGESINNADFTQAEAELYDFQDAVENTKRSHIDFRDVVDRETTPAIEDLTTATDMAKQAAEESASAFDALDMVMSDVPDATQMATNSFLDFSDDAIRAVDNIVQAFDPLFAVVGDTAGEIANFSTLITSLATGNVLGIISSTANIVLPGLTDPQRILDFEGLPTVEAIRDRLTQARLG